MIHYAKPTTARRALRRPAGLTLIEALIVLTTTVVALASAAPGFNQARERRHVEGLAAQLETDIQHARGLAVAQNRNLRFEFASDGHGSCYMVHSGSAGDCTCAPDGARCNAGVQAYRAAHVDDDSGVTLTSNVRSMVFDADKGTVSPTGTLRIQGSGMLAVHQIVNIMGRVRSCTPDQPLPGLRPC